uniref:Bone morphogenetic protein 2-like n=1 Tax=Hippocampus comes TaxID=109280 RepID=A0A3Q3DQV6_HIPCM
HLFSLFFFLLSLVRAVRFWLVLALQLRCVTVLLAGPTGTRADSDLDRMLSEKLDVLFNWKELLRGAAGQAPHKKAPQFMLDLFHAVSVSDGTRKSQKEILEGNVVRSFEDKDSFRFAVVFQMRNCASLVTGLTRFYFYIVDLYEVLDSQVKPWRGNLITSRLVPLYTQGWEVFNVTQTVAKWICNSQDNNGILIVTTLPSGTWMDSAVMSSKFRGEPADTNAYLVIFSDDGRAGASNHSYFGESTVECNMSNLPPQKRRRGAPGLLPRGHSRSCQRVSLFVDFEEIGWSGWIISPRGYNAYHCKGSCPFPLGGNLRATNHATVRSIMHALKLSVDEVEAPCCVPDKLQSISLLYFDDEENVVLKQYDDMVALSCGCH